MAKTRAGSGQVTPNLVFQGTQGIVLPVGTTTNRNNTPVAGELRYNSELNVFEGYTGTTWGTMGPYPFLNVAYFTGDATTTDFVCNFTIPNANSVIVTVNGIQLRANIDWKLVGSTTIRFEEADATLNPPKNGADITVRSFSPLSSASVPSGSIGRSQLSTANSGTTGQVLSINSSGNLQYITLPNQDPTMGGDLTGTASNAQIGAKKVGITELNVTDGAAGQVLATDGLGHLSFITPTVTNTNVLFTSLKLTPLASAPSVPNGTVLSADGVNWDPAVKSGTKSYPVYFDGTSWHALY
jgi:hypothetical protein